MASTSPQNKIGPFLATMVVTSSMIGSGVFLLPASLGAIGSISIIGYLIAALAAALIGGVFALLAIANPGTAGLFSYVRDAFGGCAGFVTGALYWASCLVACVAIALAVAGYLSVFVPVIAKPPGLTIATVAIVWLFVALNFPGPRFVAWMQSWTVFLGLLPVLFVAIGGWFFFHGTTFSASWNVSGESDLAILPRATVIAFWAFLGMESAIILSVRVRNPLRDVPIGTLGGLAIATVIYIAASAAMMGMLPAAVLAKSSAPFADAIAPVLGAVAAGGVALFAMLKASGTLATTVLLTVETAEAEAVLGSVRTAPAVEVAPRASFGNLIFTGVVASALVVLSVSPTLARQFTIVTNASVVLSLLVYGAAALALLRLGNALPQRMRIVAYVVAVLCALLCVALIAASEIPSLVGSACMIALAVAAWLVIQLRARAANRTRLLAEA
ncbi:MAG TPA: amino acid permease [Rhizomicrobium sp.]|nr:amino acid permease [Rhizomicrobium sp.]